MCVVYNCRKGEYVIVLGGRTKAPKEDLNDMKWLCSIAAYVGHLISANWNESIANKTIGFLWKRQNRNEINVLLASTNRWRHKCWPKSVSIFGIMTNSQDGCRGKPFLISNWPVTQNVCGDSGPVCTRPSVFYIVSQRMWASLKSSSWSLRWSWGRRWLEAEKKVKECTAEAIKSTQKMTFFQRCQLKMTILSSMIRTL